MKIRIYWRVIFLGSLLIGPFMLSAITQKPSKSQWRMPYKQAGLNKKQAAVLLLSRFTYGALPGQVEALEQQRLEAWFDAQLAALEEDSVLEKQLESYDMLSMSNQEIVAKYPHPGIVLREAIQQGVIDEDSLQKGSRAYQKALSNYMKEKGLRRPAELQRQIASQKILRASYTENQLEEVMTSFWFNHFNVSMTNNRSSLFIPSFERDVIRPNALGNFKTLLLETAKSPAMLHYLDNFSSASDSNAIQRKQAVVLGAKPKKGKRKPNGLNENYARELLELHTLGVDGGYTQKDVTEAARILTGWTVRPMEAYGRKNTAAVGQSEERAKRQGILLEHDFMFTSARHDEGEKWVMGKQFPSGRGYEEGLDLIAMLAEHPATAHFICKKLAIRFVSDKPSEKLVDMMTVTFRKTNGNIPSVLRTMVQTEAFWREAKSLPKIKSPFELAIGAIRNLNATLVQPYALYSWVSRMGEKLYYYQAPTGFPDYAAFWINTGSLLNRMNFGLELASGKMPGVRIDLIALNKGHEPESAAEALTSFSELLMPERDLASTMQRLRPMLADPNLAGKVAQASNSSPSEDSVPIQNNNSDRKSHELGKSTMQGDPVMLAQVVGLILGSPEYQKR